MMVKTFSPADIFRKGGALRLRELLVEDLINLVLLVAGGTGIIEEKIGRPGFPLLRSLLCFLRTGSKARCQRGEQEEERQP